MNEKQTMRCALYVRKACAEEGEPIENLAELCEMVRNPVSGNLAVATEAEIEISLYMDMGMSDTKKTGPDFPAC